MLHQAGKGQTCRGQGHESGRWGGAGSPPNSRRAAPKAAAAPASGGSRAVPGELRRERPPGSRNRPIRPRARPLWGHAWELKVRCLRIYHGQQGAGRVTAAPGIPGAGCPHRAPIGRWAGRASAPALYQGNIAPSGGGGRCGAVRAGMDLGFFPIVLPSGLCHGTPPFPYPRRGLDAFPALSTAPSSAHPPSAAGVGAAGYAAVPAADCQQPPGAACPGEAPPRPAASPCPGSGRPTSPEPERAFSCCPTPGAAPAKPRAFEWMRMKRSTPGRSEWGGGARAAATLLPAPPAQTPVPPLPSVPPPKRAVSRCFSALQATRHPPPSPCAPVSAPGS